MNRFICIHYRDSEMWVDEDGHWYETDDLIDFLMSPHEEEFVYRTVWEEDLIENQENRLLSFIRDDYNFVDFDDLFVEAWEWSPFPSF